MKFFAKSATAAAVAITIMASTLASPAEAKVRGKDIAAGILVGIAAIAIASTVDAGPPPPPRNRARGRGRGPNCGWMLKKAKRTGSDYWWNRYDECRGRW